MTVAVLAAVALHGLLVHRVRRRGRSWPAWRSACWVAGAVAAGVAAGPVADAAHMDFRAHMVGHVLLGMLAPLLLVLSAPATLLLRALPLTAARQVSRVLRSRVLTVVAHPVVAAALNVGGLWLLYRTGLFHAAMHDPLPHALVHLHVLLAGCLFTYAIAGPDPAPHRAGLPLRAAVLVLAVAAHNVLAKTLYAAPPDGVDPDQAANGAQIMYYGGAPIEVALMVLLGLEWLRTHRPAPRRDAPPAGERSSRVGPDGTVRT
jgi:putative membrane protein